MAHLTHPLRAYAKGYAIFFSIILFLFFAPLLIELYYPAAAPVAAAFVWVTDNLDRAFTAGSLIIVLTTFTLLAGDARRWFARIRARRTPAGPVALEDGVAPPPAPCSHCNFHRNGHRSRPAPRRCQSLPLRQAPLLWLQHLLRRARARHARPRRARPPRAREFWSGAAVPPSRLRSPLCRVPGTRGLGLGAEEPRYCRGGEARETQSMQVRVEVEVAVTEDIDEKAAVKA
ncbi:hypothetical protein B0H14DRAFT_2725370 [Mycena olivaceomarginata]|nr:hypothetical protein B0H14DRAFT_2725370 [Mycena olivaceomarginata]